MLLTHCRNNIGYVPLYKSKTIPHLWFQTFCYSPDCEWNIAVASERFCDGSLPSPHTKAGKETWRPVNGEGEMKAVPPGWFCWLLFEPLISPPWLHVCVFLSVCVHQLPRSVLFKAVSVLLYFQTPACSLPSLLTPDVSPALKCMMPFPSILSLTSTHKSHLCLAVSKAVRSLSC